MGFARSIPVVGIVVAAAAEEDVVAKAVSVLAAVLLDLAGLGEGIVPETGSRVDHAAEEVPVPEAAGLHRVAYHDPVAVAHQAQAAIGFGHAGAALAETREGTVAGAVSALLAAALAAAVAAVVEEESAAAVVPVPAVAVSAPSDSVGIVPYLPLILVGSVVLAVAVLPVSATVAVCWEGLDCCPVAFPILGHRFSEQPFAVPLEVHPIGQGVACFLVLRRVGVLRPVGAESAGLVVRSVEDPGTLVGLPRLAVATVVVLQVLFLAVAEAVVLQASHWDRSRLLDRRPRLAQPAVLRLALRPRVARTRVCPKSWSHRSRCGSMGDHLMDPCIQSIQEEAAIPPHLFSKHPPAQQCQARFAVPDAVVAVDNAVAVAVENTKDILVAVPAIAAVGRDLVGSGSLRQH